MLDGPVYLEHVRAAGARIVDVSTGNLGIDVPTCPGNTVESLLMHMSGVLLFWADALERSERPDPDWSVLTGDQVDVFVKMHERAASALEERAPDQPTWTWGSDQTVLFAYRRLAQELAVHRWDFENAVDATTPIDTNLAADGIDEFLEEFTRAMFDNPSVAERFGGTGQTIHLHATDTAGEWMLTMNSDELVVERTHGKGDVAARGGASDLLLFVWGRVPPAALEVFGDVSLLERWQERVKV